MTQAFYDGLAPYYHLLYPDWAASVEQQGRGLSLVLNEFAVRPGHRVLDAACGIGTQTLGLAALGYRLTASDLAPVAVARTRREADGRGLSVDCHVADLRDLSRTLSRDFAAVLVCDNALPHLLTDSAIHRALTECRRCLAPNGVLLVSVRDYSLIARRTPDVRPQGVHIVDGHRFTVDQTWKWDGDEYDLTLRIVDDAPDGEQCVHEFRSRYYAIELPRLTALFIEAGFVRVERRDAHFFQPLLVGINGPV